MKIVSIILFFVSIICLNGQLAFDKSPSNNFGNQLYVDVITLPSESSDSISLSFIFRFSNGLLKFQKAFDKVENNEIYVSNPYIEIELKDTLGIIKKRLVWNSTITESNFIDIESKTKYNYGTLKFKIFNQSYYPTIRLYENEKIKLAEDRLKIIRRVDIKENQRIFPPIFCYKNKQSDEDFNLFVLGNNASFSSRIVYLILPVNYSNKFVKYNYRIDFIQNKNSLLNVESNFGYSGLVTPESKFIKDNFVLNNSLSFIDNEILTENNGQMSGLIILSMSPDKIIPGEYSLKINSDGSKDSIETRFWIIWEDMPACLRNPEYAASMMYNILTDDEYSELNSGSNRDIYKKIFDYWKKKDPTPFTMFNEAMNEYFRRVDFCFTNYKTFGEKDGAKTERGKIYILYGKPDLVNKNIDTKNKKTEIWLYKKIKKEFIFETNSDDKWMLRKINDTGS